ncbi:MAG: alpha/beta hydrolase [Deltaproteobacteria bacterium]|nr:alpha/beta hydrolase [Deltaproteobacteria bacterium]
MSECASGAASDVRRCASIGGQTCWIHDEGHRAGFFHTFDALDIEAPGAERRPRKLHVFLPRDYEAHAKRYPVLYMNDGQTAFFTDNPFRKTWDVAGILSDARASREIPEVIVVAVHPIVRDFEYTHAPWAPGRPCCGVERYATYLTTRLLPFIDATYRTIPTRQGRGLLGSSHGGLAAFWVAVGAGDLFGAVAAMSPSFWVGLDSTPTESIRSLSSTPLKSSALYAHARRNLASPTHPRPRIWIDWGLERSGGPHNEVTEALAAVRGKEMAELLQEDFGYAFADGHGHGDGDGDCRQLVAHAVPSGGHDEDSWRQQVPNVLRWMFAGTDEMPVSNGFR